MICWRQNTQHFDTAPAGIIRVAYLHLLAVTKQVTGQHKIYLCDFILKEIYLFRTLLIVLSLSSSTFRPGLWLYSIKMC